MGFKVSKQTQAGQRAKFLIEWCEHFCNLDIVCEELLLLRAQVLSTRQEARLWLWRPVGAQERPLRQWASCSGAALPFSADRA